MAMKGLFIGLTSIDILYLVDHFPVENTKLRSVGDFVDLGGPATNAAFAFQALGGEATLISYIGDHPFTQFIRSKLSEYGICHLDVNSGSNREPVISSILLNVGSGERTIITRTVEADVDIIHPDVQLYDYDVICVDGFLSAYTLDMLKQNHLKIPVIFDGGSYKSCTDQIVPWVTYPIFSDDFHPPGFSTIRAYLEQFGISHFAVTRGKLPIRVFDGKEKPDIPISRIEAVDTLAAGDIFHGAFAKFIIEPKTNFRSALIRAADIATLSCQSIGPRAWVEQIG